jgi:hypothetical protein
MAGGRDRGEVKDFPFVEAQELLRSGEAAPINFNEPDPLQKIEDFEVRADSDSTGIHKVADLPVEALPVKDLPAEAPVAPPAVAAKAIAKDAKPRKKS